MPETKIYNLEGKETGKVKLPAEIFDLEMNSDLIHQAVIAQTANQRQVLAHTKDRGEVRGGGKKPWRQKGTGRARHGSIRSPLWKGGGITFGPTKERVFKKKINRKMKRKALFMVLSTKAKNNQIIILEELKIEQPKTKEMIKLIDKLIPEKKRNLLIIADDLKIIRAAKNISGIKILKPNNINILDLLKYKYLLMPKQIIEMIGKKLE